MLSIAPAVNNPEADLVDKLQYCSRPDKLHNLNHMPAQPTYQQAHHDPPSPMVDLVTVISCLESSSDLALL